MDFDKLGRLFLPLAVSGVLEVKQSSYSRLVEKIPELEFVVRSVTKTTDNITIQLQIIDEQSLHLFLSGEANKFWLASMFSLNRACQNQFGNAAWQAVEHYYAAYYAVHYLLRISGVSLTNLDQRAITKIQDNSLGLSMPNSIPTGLYVLRYNEVNKILTMQKDIKKGSGGSHQDVWRLWDELIDRLQREANSDAVEYASTSIELSAHRSFVVRSTGKYNPPEMRGEINYQFKNNVWVFEEGSANMIKQLQTYIPQSAVSPECFPLNARALVSNNKLIIGLAKTIFKSCANKYPRSICRALIYKYSRHLKSEMAHT